jgi:nitrogen fixation protein FixH
MDQALPFDLQPGTELSIDMKTHLQQTYRVRGSITDAVGQPVSVSSMKLFYTTPVGGSGNISVANYDSRTGRFELEGIPSGSFVLQARLRDGREPLVRLERPRSMFPTARVQ